MIEEGGRSRETKEATPWQEGRRETLQSLRNPINLLAMNISRFEEKKEKCEAAGKPIEYSLEEGHDALREALGSMTDELHLKVGVPPGYSEHPYKLSFYTVNWDTKKYKRGVCALDDPEIEKREPEEGEEVFVVSPYIEDELLHEQVQPLLVRLFSDSEKMARAEEWDRKAEAEN
jgi:hypothetical protein